MALRAVATERAVSFTNTALRRGETRSGADPVVEILKSEFVSKCGAKYIESFDAKNKSSDSKVGQSQNRETHHSGVNALASLCNLWCRLKELKLRWRPITRANYLSVLANPSLKCAVPRRCLSAGANPVRQLSLQPVAIGATVEVTNRLKPSV